MLREIICPGCGTLLPVDPPPSPPDPDAPSHSHHTSEIVIPATVSLADVSLDDVRLIADPDPALRSFVAGDGRPVEPEGPTAAIEVVAAPAAAEGPVAIAAPALSSRVEGDEERPVGRGRSWLVPLLVSYASAMTLACAYLLWLAPRRGGVAETLPPDSRPAGAALEPIPRERLTSLGRPLRVGSLEWTPLEVRVGRARLVRPRPGGRRETRDGGAGSLVLTMRLHNLAADATFAPLDRAFVRLPDRGPPDTLIEVQGDGTIDVYPLAVTSELTIAGQSFEPLGPGQERETLVVSDRQAVDRARGTLTWRLRLRTSPDQTEVVGVEFHEGDIR